MTRRTQRIYRIFFNNQGKSYEIYARHVEQDDLQGFVRIEDLLFGEKSSIVVDPAEDALKKEFSGVRCLHLPFHSIFRIDEVEKEGAGKVLSLTPTAGEGASPSMPPGHPGGKN
jgi:hypothetical protein